MKRVIIFRFHQYPEICASRLRLLAKYNPGIPIFGLYGGRPGGLAEFRQCIGKYLESICSLENESDEWKWKNSDLGLRRWFALTGKDVDFDMLTLVEWDLLLFGGLDDIYRGIPAGAIGLTALTKLKNVENRWIWTSREPYRKEWIKFLELVKNQYGYLAEPYASLGPGYCLPKSFLEKYCAIDVPDLCHDELRLPLFGQILGFELYDTGFYRKWFDAGEHRFFNCMGKPIGHSTIVAELAKKQGRRVFHPFCEPTDF